MAGKQVICLGDTTDHGGVVISALDNYTVNGRPVATEGDSVSCPKCKGVFQIASGSSLMTFQEELHFVSTLILFENHQ